VPESGSNQQQSGALDPGDAWIAKLDYEAFAKDVSALGKEIRSQSGTDDVEHLYKLIEWRNIFAAVGMATVWTAPNPITIMALSTWTYSSWALVAHHTCHGGYNRVDAGSRFKSRNFAIGQVNRFIDWLDWIQPEAWNIEHNRLHHYNLNEGTDPDLVQRNMVDLREKDIPMIAKYAYVLGSMLFWKWFYYAPNTYKELRINELLKKSGGAAQLPKDFDRQQSATVIDFLDPTSPYGRILRRIAPLHKLAFEVMGPMLLGRFVLVPALLWAIGGPVFASHAFWNLVAAEILTNAHSFVTIVTNHAGEDLYTFDGAVKPNTGSFYIRQIVGSTNYPYGTDGIDFWHGFLNYQIEHHVWPDFSMLQYQRAAPKLKAICEKHGVPYVQENVFVRLQKTADIMVGKATMRVFPTKAYEPVSDKVGGRAYWESTNGALED
jgi:fatty acid desaturase